jgi:hypothetical protein
MLNFYRSTGFGLDPVLVLIPGFALDPFLLRYPFLELKQILLRTKKPYSNK